MKGSFQFIIVEAAPHPVLDLHRTNSLNLPDFSNKLAAASTAASPRVDRLSAIRQAADICQIRRVMIAQAMRLALLRCQKDAPI